MSERVAVGRVGRPHGRDGAFVVENASDNPALFEPGVRLLVGEERVAVTERKRAGGRLVVRLERRVDRGSLLELLRSELPAPGDDSYYVADLVGLDVVEEGGRALGRVREVAAGVANDVLELDSGLALPMHEECVLEVSVAERRILVARGFAEPE